MFQKGANLAAMLAVSRYNDPVRELWYMDGLAIRHMGL